jgi:hypothetical protein
MICAGTITGHKLTYDNEGRLTAWLNAQASPTSIDSFLYDGEGNRVEQQSVVSRTTTTTVYVGGVEDVKTSAGTTISTTYYTLGGQRIALAVNGTVSYLASDRLGNTSVALDGAGNVSVSQLFAPYGTSRYSIGTMPTDRGSPHDADASATNTELVHTTDIHPWLTGDRGWLLAGELELHQRTREQADYYNLTVSELHTYAVGGGQFVVDNYPGPDSAGSGNGPTFGRSPSQPPVPSKPISPATGEDMTN